MDYSFKILIIGNSGVGKTCLLNRYTNDVFGKDHISTIGIDFQIKTVEFAGKRIKLQLWDTAGQERFRALTQAYYRATHGVVVVFDVTDRRSFYDAEEWIRVVQDLNTTVADLVVVGNKSDRIDERTVTCIEGETLAAKYGGRYLEVSAKQDHGVDEVFQGLMETIFKRHERMDEPIRSVDIRAAEPRRSGWFKCFW